MRRASRGFTLVELMVTISVLLVLAVIAMPQVGPFLQRQRLKNATMDLASTVVLARSEAIKRNGTIYVIANGTDWSRGWTVSSAAAVSAASTIRSQNALDGLRISESGSNTSFNFGGDGRMAGTGMSFTVQPTVTSQGQQPLCVAVGATGRVQTTKGACS
jgi:type IV fimbrial biogenesis protein FimT